MVNYSKSKFYQNTLNYGEILTLIESAQNGDLISKNKLLKLNTGLINKVVLKYLSSGLEKDDLFQLGCIGLVKAIDRFNPSLGYMFSSYAVPMIEGEIKRFLRDDGIIKVSRELKGIHWKIKKYKDFIFKETGREPKLEELSAELNIPIEKIKLSLIALSPVEYFETYDPENEYFQLDLENNVVKEDELSYSDLIELNEIIDNMPEMERKVLKLRYFDDFTQTTVGKILGISQVQVSRLEKKAIQLLKNEYTN